MQTHGTVRTARDRRDTLRMLPLPSGRWTLEGCQQVGRFADILEIAQRSIANERSTWYGAAIVCPAADAFAAGAR